MTENRLSITNTGWLCLAIGCVLPTACTRKEPIALPGNQPGLYTHASPEPRPAVVVLHGISGIFAAYHSLAETLAEHGYVVRVADYYAETGPVRKGDAADVQQQQDQHWPVWVRSVQKDIQRLQSLPRVQADRIGVVGISQGAFLAISAAGMTPAIKVVVEFYGGARNDIEDYVQNVPPVLILHGEADVIVPVSFAGALNDTLTRHERTVEMQIYPGAPHGFIVEGSSGYRPSAATDAIERMLAFLDRFLKAP